MSKSIVLNERNQPGVRLRVYKTPERQIQSVVTKRLVVVWSHEGQGIDWKRPQIKPGDENPPECSF